MPEENPLINLKDIHLPPAVAIWPPAPGWWIVAVVLLLMFEFFPVEIPDLGKTAIL